MQVIFHPIIGLISTKTYNIEVGDYAYFNPIIGLISTAMFFKEGTNNKLFQSHYRSDFNVEKKW